MHIELLDNRRRRYFLLANAVLSYVCVAKNLLETLVALTSGSLIAKSCSSMLDSKAFSNSDKGREGSRMDSAL
jgi:hypothetical protein